MDRHLIALGKSFKARREKLGMTHEDVAEAADLNVNYYARIERGEVNTSVKKIFSIASALNIELSKLVNDAEKIVKHK